MNDLINRKAAIDTLDVGAELLRRVLDDTDIVGAEREKYKWGLELIESCISDMKELPPAQPERKRGKWIEREVTYIDNLEAKDIITAWQSCKCSVCGRYDTKPYMYYFDAPKYCSCCGAKMEVADGNTD